MQGGDNGTPTQKDEPQAPNPPNGAAIDYYLKTAATGPVTLEILDAGGACLAMFSSDAAAAAGCAGAAAAAVDAARRWGRRTRRGRRHPEHVGAVAPGARAVRDLGRHAPRDLGPRRRRRPRRWRRRWRTRRPWRRSRGAVGPFTAKLTVNGQSYTQTFPVKPDPRLK